MPKHVIVLGAGISGLSVAWRLSDNDIKVDVLESSSSIGGLAATLRQNHYCLDYGPHSFFSDDQNILKTVLGLFDDKSQLKPRRAKFYYQGRYLDYPLKSESLLFQMGLCSGIRATMGFLKSKLPLRKATVVESEAETVEDWAIANFGKHLYQTFFKPYTEQFWEIPCGELSSRSIPTHTQVSFMNSLRSLLHRQLNKTKGSQIEREMLPTFYPRSGFAEIAERITKIIEKNQGCIHLNCKVVGVKEFTGGKMRAYYQHNGQAKEMDADYIISTIPLPLLVKMIEPPAPEEVLALTDKLDYRPLVVLGMLTQKQNILNCEYIYLLDRPFNRIFEMNEFSSYTSKLEENIIAVEISSLRNSTIWTKTKEELFDMCIGSLAEDGFLTAGDVKRLFLIKAPYTFPIYRKGYATDLNRIMDYLKKYNFLATLGRSGEFMYMDTDKCMKRAFDFAHRLLTNYQQREAPPLVNKDGPK